MSQSPQAPEPPAPLRHSLLAAGVRRLLLLSLLWYLPFFRLMGTTDEGEIHALLQDRAVARGGPHLAQVDLTVAVLAGPFTFILRGAPEGDSRPVYGGSFALGIVALVVAMALGPGVIGLLLWARGVPRDFLRDLIAALGVAVISVAWHACGLAAFLGV